MNKLILIALALILSFSCNRKSTEGWIPLTKKELKQHKGLLDTIGIYNRLVKEHNERMDSLSSEGITFGGEHLTIDTSLYSPSVKLSFWKPTLDTSDVIIKYVSNWEEGKIETLAAKVVYQTSQFGIWLGITGQESKLFKVKDGVWIPIEWPKDPVELYIKPKK